MDLDSKLEKIKSHFGGSILSVEYDKACCPILWTTREQIVAVMSYLQTDDDLKYEFLSDLTCYDDLGEPEAAQGRFVMVYNLFSPAFKNRIRIKLRVHEDQSVPTLVSLWRAADWAEREVWDMYGIKFEGHPDLRRILMDQRFEGFPQRKDYHWRKYQLFLDAEPIPEHLLKD